MSGMSGIISVRGLSKDYFRYRRGEGLGGALRSFFSREKITKTAVDNISFDIGEGEIVGFLGPNGAGKTTTIKMLSGILHPTSGEAEVMGFIPWQRKKQMKMQLAVVMGQKQQLWWDLPARESLRLNGHIYEISESRLRDNMTELCALLDVTDLLDAPVRSLSLGERMKFELIASLLHQPRVIFLDEPTIGLDIISQKKILGFLKEMNRTHRTTLLLTSHNMLDIETLCDRTIIINHGKLIYDGRLSGLSAALGQKKIIKVESLEPISLIELTAFGKVLEFNDYRASIEVARDEVQQCAAHLFQRYPIADLNIEDIPLETSIEYIFTNQSTEIVA